MLILQTEGRITVKDIAERIHLSSPPTLARLKRLEQFGYIEGYKARLNKEALGMELLFFTLVNLHAHQYKEIERFREAINEMPQVLECTSCGR